MELPPITHAHTCRFNCHRCILGRQIKPPPDGADCSSNLSQWQHCSEKRGLEDQILKKVWDGPTISFVFHQKSHDKKIETV